MRARVWSSVASLAGCVAGLLAGCAEAPDRHARFQYAWDDRRVLCSRSVDDFGGDLNRIGDSLVYASSHQTAPLVHAHLPTLTISLEQLFCMFDLVGNVTLPYVTFGELEHGPARSGFVLAFDDEGIDTWYAWRGIFRAHHARVTFFVSGFHLWSDEQRGKLAELAAEGHDVQAHGVNHLNALDYLADHTVADYVEQEVLPSVAMLEAAGYPITTFAFPGGASNAELNAGVLEYLPRVRLTAHHCPY